MSIPERRELLKEQHRCFNCLGSNHSVYQCRSRRACQICRKRHHTLVHSAHNDDRAAKQQESDEVVPTSNALTKPSTSKTYSSTTEEPYLPDETSNNHSLNENAMLPTVLVDVKDAHNNWHVIRELLDSGSTRSFIKESYVNKLGLNKSNARVLVSGIGGAKAGSTKGMTNIEIRSRNNHEVTYQITTLIVPKLTLNLPSHPIDVNIPLEVENRLADPTFNIPGPIDLLIGSDHFFEMLEEGKIPISDPTLIAQNTKLGWLVAGGIASQMNVSPERVYLTEHQELNIDQTLRSFWETEEISSTVQYTIEEAACIEHYSNTVSTNNKGRIIVGLPFKRMPPNLGQSYTIALYQFHALEKRLCANRELRCEYIKFMQDYERLGHMAVIKPNEIEGPDHDMFYLPHHGIFKKSDPSRLRVVFNGSQKTSTGQSLNEELMVGPTIQQGLFEILLRYRKYQFVFCADIEKMYRQVMIRAQDTDYQRILWRESPNHQLKHYRLLTVTYGTSSAPFLATNSLKYIADQFQHQYPITSERIKSDVYVDDVLTGSSSLTDALKIRDELMVILNSAGFCLKKWSANHPNLLNDIEETELQISEREFAITETISVLGLYYQPARDTFKFKVCLPTHGVLTKRGLLSESSRIFDPMGWLSPIMITIKVLFQTLWLEKLGWDEELPESCRARWIKLRSELGSIEELEVQRWLSTNDTLEIHGFADASKDAYAAVLYSRVVTSHGEVHINIIAAKTKVAPIKTVSIPKLELCAATLLVKLIEKVTIALNFPNHPKQFFYTDASIVLDWLSKPPKVWPTYIGNRTGLILTYSNRNQWYHVQTKQNPADRATRGVTPSNLKDDTLWWKGPSWLSIQPLITPNVDWDVSCDVVEESQSYLVQNVNEFQQRLDEMMSRVSSYPRIVRIVARIQRLIDNLKHSTVRKQFGRISVDEFNKAENYVIKHIQRQSFSSEIQSIKSGKPSNKNKLTNLYPFLDNQDILRVSGRLTNSTLNYDTKHPIILPSSHVTVKRMIEYVHRKLCHAGISHMVAHVKQRYHIVRGKHLIKKTINQCLKCHRYRKKVQGQLMGQLPLSRVSYVRPFIQSGIDYAGPYPIKAHQVRNSKFIKGYLCIFTCMATKAIHIELVTNLSTDSYIAALRRFQSTRGICTDLYSDNATNFIGAIAQLRELRDLFQSEAFLHKLHDWNVGQGTKWHLIPPAAPNFGGLWEAAVKSTKFHIKRVIGETILNYEEFLTFLKQVEAILNSRPLCRNDDSDDPLTPAHFILGHPLTLVPEPSLIHTKLNILSRWQMLQRMIQHFWLRWHDEYLTTLNQINRSSQPGNQVNIGDVVILKDNNVSPARWPLAKIIDVHPGRDNLVRVVTVKTASGTFKRPISKISLLPLNDSDESWPAECSTSSQQ